MLTYITFSLHTALYNDYTDEDIADWGLPYSDTDLPDTVPAEEQAASPSPTAGSPPDDAAQAGSPTRSPGLSRVCPLPRKPPRFGRRTAPPVNVTQIIRLAGPWGTGAGCCNFMRGCGH